jgi:hypothetical protein
VPESPEPGPDTPRPRSPSFEIATTLFGHDHPMNAQVLRLTAMKRAAKWKFHKRLMKKLPPIQEEP